MRHPYGLLEAGSKDADHCTGVLIDGVKSVNVVKASDIEGWANVIDLEATKDSDSEYMLTKRVTGNIQFLWDNADAES